MAHKLVQWRRQVYGIKRGGAMTRNVPTTILTQLFHTSNKGKDVIIVFQYY